MNATDPVTLEQNARASELRRKALRDLQSSKSPALSFTYLGLVLLGGFWGWFISTKITESLPLLGMAAGAAFFLAAAAFRECVIIRRRLEAAVALLLQSNAL